MKDDPARLPMLPDPLLPERQSPLAPLHLRMARAAVEKMDEAERIGFALELIRDTCEPSNAFHLLRLERLAGDLAGDLMKVQFARDCG